MRLFILTSNAVAAVSRIGTVDHTGSNGCAKKQVSLFCFGFVTHLTGGTTSHLGSANNVWGLPMFIVKFAGEQPKFSIPVCWGLNFEA